MLGILRIINRLKKDEPMLMVKLHFLMGVIPFVILFLGVGLHQFIFYSPDLYFLLIIFLIIIPLIVVILGFYLLVDKQFMEQIKDKHKIIIIIITVINLIILVE
jgi:hypothetical protein